MADGAALHEGAAAMNDRPFGSQVQILTGTLAGAVLTVEDRYGWGTQLDVFMWDCWAARQYGRQVVEIAAVP